MGSPDPMQIDGIGGTHIVTSKIAIIKPSTREHADVDYMFVQIGVKDGSVDYRANCGNISAAVGPFAVREGLVPDYKPGVSIEKGLATRQVRVYNTGTRKIFISHVPVDSRGRVVDRGNFEIAGCPGKAAPILLDYSHTIGDRCLPTGNATDTIEVGGRRIECTFCEIANQVVFAKASDFDLAGDEEPGDLDYHHDIIAKVKELRGKAAQLVGMCKDWTNVDAESPMLPMVALLSPPTDKEGHIQSRLFLDNKCHTSMAGTGATCSAACSRIPGTVVDQVVDPRCLNENVFNIQHPLGIMPVAVKIKEHDGEGEPEFETLSFIRTARRIAKGELDVPDDIQEQYAASLSNGHT